jgi:nucleotide-binding universal stress UspA family protein
MESSVDYKTLLLHLRLCGDNQGLLEIAGDLASRFKSHVIGVAVAQPMPALFPAMQTTYGAGMPSEDIVETDRNVTEQRIDQTEKTFRAALEGRAASLEWRSTITNNSRSHYVARQARAADLVISMPLHPKAVVDQSQQVNVGDIVMYTGRPVLLVPAAAQHLDLGTAVVGFKDTRETRRALADALPLLKLTGRVVIVEIAARQDQPDAQRHVADAIAWLKRHGIAAEARIENFKGVDADQLEAIAQDYNAGLLVAGAYGHTRLREWIVGGVTMDLLLQPRRVTLVSH